MPNSRCMCGLSLTANLISRSKSERGQMIGQTKWRTRWIDRLVLGFFLSSSSSSYYYYSFVLVPTELPMWWEAAATLPRFLVHEAWTSHHKKPIFIFIYLGGAKLNLAPFDSFWRQHPVQHQASSKHWVPRNVVCSPRAQRKGQSQQMTRGGCAATCGNTFTIRTSLHFEEVVNCFPGEN